MKLEKDLVLMSACEWHLRYMQIVTELFFFNRKLYLKLYRKQLPLALLKNQKISYLNKFEGKCHNVTRTDTAQ